MTKIRVVSGVLAVHGGIFLARRSATEKWFPGRWEFPGGKVEPGET